jgi:hypothetical protein
MTITYTTSRLDVNNLFLSGGGSTFTMPIRRGTTSAEVKALVDEADPWTSKAIYEPVLKLIQEEERIVAEAVKNIQTLEQYFRNQKNEEVSAEQIADILEEISDQFSELEALRTSSSTDI